MVEEIPCPPPATSNLTILNLKLFQEQKLQNCKHSYFSGERIVSYVPLPITYVLIFSSQICIYTNPADVFIHMDCKNSSFIFLRHHPSLNHDTLCFILITSKLGYKSTFLISSQYFKLIFCEIIKFYKYCPKYPSWRKYDNLFNN